MLVLATLVGQFLAVVALDYTDLEAMGVACRGRDSCVNMAEPHNFSMRNCECDAFCGTYGDCCIDVLSAPRTVNTLKQDCMSFGKTLNMGAYVISHCPHRGGSSESACTEKSLRDPLAMAPVSTPEGATYRNAYCAECNGADLEDLVKWLPLVNCPTLAPYNLSGDFIWGGLEHADDEWGVWYGEQFHRCDVLFDKPDSVENLRLCRADVVSSCPVTYRRKRVRRQCESSYTAVMYSEKAAYRNAHCAICNGVNVDTLVCDSNEVLSRNTNKFTFAHLFDVDRSDGDCVGIVNCCSKDQMYDPFHKKCRNLVCAVPGYELKKNKCVKV